MCVTVIFAGLMMFVIGTRRSELFQPPADVLDQAAFEIVDIDRSGDMHRRNEAEAVFDATPANNLFHLIGDVHHLPALHGFEDEVLSMTLHFSSPHRPYPKETQTHAQSAEAHSQRGIELILAHHPVEAAQAFRDAIAADPAYYEAHHGLVRALRDAGKLEESIAAALALTVLTPDDPLAHTALSISLQAAGKVPEAEASAARARILEWKIELESPGGQDGGPQKR
jgi:tetratricopeptide (TPR) repeat protein